MATQLLAQHHPATPAAPASERTAKPGPTLLTASRSFATARLAATVTALAPSPTLLRSFVTLGALRCDDDVGLHTLFALFRI